MKRLPEEMKFGSPNAFRGLNDRPKVSEILFLDYAASRTLNPGFADRNAMMPLPVF